MNKKSHYLIVLLGFLLSPGLFAKGLTLSVGNLCEYVGQIQTDGNGSKNAFSFNPYLAIKNVCSFNPYLATSLDYQLTPQLFLSPQIGFSVPVKSGSDENVIRMNFIVLLNAKYKTNFVNMIGGMGFFLTRISGPGGEAVLNNGTSTDSFPLPEEAIYTRNFIINLGLELQFTQDWSGELRSYIFNLTTSEDRAYSLGVHATYHFGAQL